MSSQTHPAGQAPLCERVPQNPSVAARLLRPSFLDCFFAAVLIWLFAAGAGGWVGLLADADTGWHIRTGEYILDTRSVPVADLYSFSKPGQPWFAWEWLADVVFALVHRAAGLQGLVLLCGVLISLTAALLVSMMISQGANALLALALTLVVTGASSFHHLARPHLFTLLAVVVTQWILTRDLTEPSRRVWILVPLTAVWVNLHGGFLVLIANLVLAAAAMALSDPARAKRYGILAACCSAASLVNPYGWRLHAHIYQYLRSDWIRETVQEFHSPSFRSENMQQLELMLLAGLILAGVLIARRRLAPALWILFWGFEALSSVRHFPIYGLIAAPLLAAALTEEWNRRAAAAARASLAGTLRDISADMAPGLARLSVWGILVVAALGAGWFPTRFPNDFPDVKFPVRMTARFGQRLQSSRVFTQDQWGDYLIYRNYPRQRVFVDGRSDFYGKDLGDQYLRLSLGRRGWRKVLDGHGFDFVLAPRSWPLASLLGREPGWRLVGEDELAVLFERRKLADESVDYGTSVPVQNYQTSRSNEKKPAGRSNETL